MTQFGILNNMAESSLLSSYEACVIPSNRLKAFLKEKLKDENLPTDLHKSIQHYFGNCKMENSISVKLVRNLANWYLAGCNTEPYFHQLMSGCEICLPHVPVPPKNPELQARLELLKQQMDERQYQQMIKNVNPALKHKHSNEFRNDIKAMQSHMVAAFNFVVTVGACFLFGYKAVEYLLPTPRIAAQVLMGLIVGSIGALADLYFLIKQLDMSER